MDASALKRITEALRDRIQGALSGVTVHVGPLDDEEAANKTLALFLYRLAINADLRNRRRVVPPRGVINAPPLEFTQALPFDLHYLLTASPSRMGDDLEGLAQLGAAIQLIHGAPEVTGIAVQGELVRLSLDPISIDEMSRVWQLFPAANYRTSIAFIASPVWIDPPAPEVVGATVVIERYRVGPMTADSV